MADLLTRCFSSCSNVMIIPHPLRVRMQRLGQRLASLHVSLNFFGMLGIMSGFK